MIARRSSSSDVVWRPPVSSLVMSVILRGSRNVNIKRVSLMRHSTSHSTEILSFKSKFSRIHTSPFVD